MESQDTMRRGAHVVQQNLAVVFLSIGGVLTAACGSLVPALSMARVANDLSAFGVTAFELTRSGPNVDSYNSTAVGIAISGLLLGVGLLIAGVATVLQYRIRMPQVLGMDPAGGPDSRTVLWRVALSMLGVAVFAYVVCQLMLLEFAASFRMLDGPANVAAPAFETFRDRLVPTLFFSSIGNSTLWAGIGLAVLLLLTIETAARNASQPPAARAGGRGADGRAADEGSSAARMTIVRDRTSPRSAQ